MLARSVLGYSSTNFATLAKFLASMARTIITQKHIETHGPKLYRADQDKDVVETMRESNHLLQLQGMIQLLSTLLWVVLQN